MLESCKVVELTEAQIAAAAEAAAAAAKASKGKGGGEAAPIVPAFMPDAPIFDPALNEEWRGLQVRLCVIA